MIPISPAELTVYNDATNEEIETALALAGSAFEVYRKLSLRQRANFMRAIATEIEALGESLLDVAAAETHLTRERLATERTRTCFQLRSYADACERGDHLDIRIDHGKAGKPELRKMMFPLGPVAVFGAANFPFAYSTAGGDTACALAAGCPVVVKAHPAHSNTSEMVAGAVSRAADLFHLPAGVFLHLHGASTRVGRALVEHPVIRAVGFTGSFAGGKQLAEWASQRKVPIPVFAEMSSINPVFILPGKMIEDAGSVAEQLALSIVLGAGQFCTNPGLIIAPDNKQTDEFITRLAEQIRATKPAQMLNAGIFKNYVERRANALAQPGVEMQAVSDGTLSFNEGAATLAVTDAATFIANPLLHGEVFGPYSLIVKCADSAQMLEVAASLEGQLTHSLFATEGDLRMNSELTEMLQYNCGRFILNGVPTGVEVCLSMHHGGPYPATTDSRFTSVGADAIRRFVRPVSFQNWPQDLLPEELQDGNPNGLWRTINNKVTKEPVPTASPAAHS